MKCVKSAHEMEVCVMTLVALCDQKMVTNDGHHQTMASLTRAELMKSEMTRNARNQTE
jgi:hypothetical protein